MTVLRWLLRIARTDQSATPPREIVALREAMQISVLARELANRRPTGNEIGDAIVGSPRRRREEKPRAIAD